MKEVVIPLPPDLLRRIDELARRDERTRPAEIRYLLRWAVESAEAELQRQEVAQWSA